MTSSSNYPICSDAGATFDFQQEQIYYTLVSPILLDWLRQ